MKLTDRRERDRWDFEQATALPTVERVNARVTLTPGAARALAWLLRALLRIVTLGLLGRE